MTKQPAMITMGIVFLACICSAQAADAPAPIELKQGDRVVFLGDSITQQGSKRGGYVTRVAQALAERKKDLGISVINAGISGHKVPNLQALLQRDVLAKKPTIVVIYIGINDVWHSARGRGTPRAAYEKGLRDIIARIAAVKARVVLCTPSVIGEKTGGANQMDKMLDEYSAISRKVAADTGVGMLDLRKEFLAYLQKHNTKNQARGVLTGDSVHLNAAGNRFVADLMLGALGVKAAEAKVPVKAGSEAAGVLTPAAVADPKGDGPDGKGNTGDDTWQFWLGIGPKDWRRMTIATASMTPEQRKKGIRGKVHGPIAGSLPTPKDTDGWIFHTDWDGRYEGVWGDKKAGQVLAHPFQEKMAGGPVAVTYKVPADGTYAISGKVTDLQPVKVNHYTITGIKWSVEVVAAGDGNALGGPQKVLNAGGPIGDAQGPPSAEFKVEKAELKKGQLVRLVIDPNKFWGTDLTRIELKIAPAK